MNLKAGTRLPYLVVGMACFLLASTGCGSSSPEASLPPQQADAVKALEALNAKTSIRDGKVFYVDFYALPDAASAAGHLKNLPHIEKLNFSSTNMTDDALVHLAELRELKDLGLWGTQVTDKGLIHLAPLTKLERLNLNENNVTDAGLEHLGKLKSLTHLYLNGTKVSDAGLAHLAGLEKLQWIDIFGTSVTSAGAASFREHHPNTEVVVSGDDEASEAQNPELPIAEQE
jgi:hypothetical protein